MLVKYNFINTKSSVYYGLFAEMQLRINHLNKIIQIKNYKPTN